MNKELNIMKNYSIITLCINIAAIIFHILPYLGLMAVSAVSTILFLVAVGIDLGIIYLTLITINRADNIGQNLKKLCWLYLLVFMLAICLLMADALVYSFIEVGSILRIFTQIGSQIGYIAIFGLGIYLSFYIIQNADRTETWK